MTIPDIENIYDALEAKAKGTVNSYFESYDITGTDKAMIISNTVQTLISQSVNAVLQDDVNASQISLNDKQKDKIDKELDLLQSQKAEVLASTTRQDNEATAKIELMNKQKDNYDTHMLKELNNQLTQTFGSITMQGEAIPVNLEAATKATTNALYKDVTNTATTIWS